MYLSLVKSSGAVSSSSESVAGGSDVNQLFQAALRHQRSGNLAEAVDGYNRVLRQDPSARDALNNLGVALRALGQRDAALVAYRRLHSIHPPRASSLINLGNLLRELGQFEECWQTFEDALKYAPQSRSALYGLGLVARDCNRLADSLSFFDKALAQEPDDPDLHWDRAQTLLRMGDYERGFEAYESRWALARTNVREFETPEWDGAPLNGRTLLLFGEQGFGDAIQFVRFIPSLAAIQNTSVVLEVRPELVRLFQGQIEGVERVVPRGERLPAHDCNLPLLSVPRLLRTTLATVPSEPYIKPKLGFASIRRAPKGALNVGLAWAGSQSQANDHNRTFALKHLLPVLESPNCSFFSFQKGESAKQLEELGVRHLIVPLGPSLKDFADSSAVMDKLDLVITADTSVAHLAGAMGKPVWIALSIFHDWRYDANGSISNWYPSARVFRQSVAGDWAGVFEKISFELERQLEPGVISENFIRLK